MMMDLIFFDNVHTIIIISKIFCFMVFICEEDIYMNCVKRQDDRVAMYYVDPDERRERLWPADMIEATNHVTV